MKKARNGLGKLGTVDLAQPQRARDTTRLRSAGAEDPVGAVRPQDGSTATIAFPFGHNDGSVGSRSSPDLHLAISENGTQELLTPAATVSSGSVYEIHSGIERGVHCLDS